MTICAPSLEEENTVRPADTLLVAEAAFLLRAVHYGLRWLRYPTLLHILRRSATLTARCRREPRGTELEVLWAIGWVWGKGIAVPSCLEEALTVQWMLRRRCIESQVRIGVVKSEAGTLLGHAWAERDGRVVSVDQGSPARYVVLTPPMVGE
jgi:hypothetical protein